MNTINSLDLLLQVVGGVRNMDRPEKGWLATIRKALHVSQADVAKTLEVTQSTVAAFERNEVNRAITLGSLDKAGEALNCKVVYLIVPSDGLTFQQLANTRERTTSAQPKSQSAASKVSDSPVEPPPDAA